MSLPFRVTDEVLLASCKSAMKNVESVLKLDDAYKLFNAETTGDGREGFLTLEQRVGHANTYAISHRLAELLEHKELMAEANVQVDTLRALIDGAAETFLGGPQTVQDEPESGPDRDDPTLTGFDL